MSSFVVHDWGEVDYPEAVRRQLELVQEVAGGAPDQIVFCSHPPVVTLGRFRGASDIEGWSGPIVESSRGGRATYHGPSQMVVYPIINLTRPRKDLKDRDVGGYLKALGQAVIATLQELGVEAELRQGQDIDEQGLKRELTGVWVGPRKVASIGVAVKKWVTYHGLALNVDHDPQAFHGIRPCGFKPEVMVSLEELLGRRVPRTELAKTFLGNSSLFAWH